MQTWEEFRITDFSGNQKEIHSPRSLLVIAVTASSSNFGKKKKNQIFRAGNLFGGGGKSAFCVIGADIHDPKERTSTTQRGSPKLWSQKLRAEFS